MRFSKKYLIVTLLGFYALLHIIKLEFFPFYLFAMYSEDRDVKTEYVSYELLLDGETFDFKQINYRQYIYLNNTFISYDAIYSSKESVNPESEIISKYYNLIGLNHLAQTMITDYRHQNVQQQMTDWLRRFIKTDRDIQLIRKKYEWIKGGDINELSSENILI